MSFKQLEKTGTLNRQKNLTRKFYLCVPSVCVACVNVLLGKNQKHAHSTHTQKSSRKIYYI